MSRLLPLTFAICAATGAVAEPLRLTGAIGPYEVELELERAGDVLDGRYRYTGRDAWLDLRGEAFGNDAFQMTEGVDGAETGAFYLEVLDDGLTGFWAAGEQDHPVELVAQGAISEVLVDPSAPDVNAALTGQYYVGEHWVSDWFAPNYEIGFNGGTVNVVEISDETVLVGFTFVVGPTYHIASFQGVAQRQGDGRYVHDAVLAGSDGPCRLVFTFAEGELSISDIGNGFACQFGMRAHANFDLMKISNIAEFGEDW